VKITVCVLAGGKGGRIGGDKCLKTLAGRRLIDLAVDIALRVECRLKDSRVVMASRNNDLAVNGIESLRDVAGKGPVAGLYSCLLRYGSTLVFPCDMPFLPSDLLLHLVEAGRGHDLAVCRFDGLVQPQVGVYSESCLTAIEEFISEGKFSLFRIINESGLDAIILDEAELTAFGNPARMFLNINTGEQLEEAQKLGPDPDLP